MPFFLLPLGSWVRLAAALQLSAHFLLPCKLSRLAVATFFFPLPGSRVCQEMDHFSPVVLNNESCRTPGEMGLADMRIVDALQQSLQTGAPVKLQA